jgi:hypothetical protein
MQLPGAGDTTGQVEDKQRRETGGPTQSTDKSEKVGPPATELLMKPPPDIAVKAYRLKWILGVPTQTKIAEILSQQLGKPITQGQVSKWLRQAEEYVSKCGLLPGLPAASTGKPKPIDPERLDLGHRQDRHAERQRERRSEDD